MEGSAIGEQLRNVQLQLLWKSQQPDESSCSVFTQKYTLPMHDELHNIFMKERKKTSYLPDHLCLDDVWQRAIACWCNTSTRERERGRVTSLANVRVQTSMKVSFSWQGDQESHNFLLKERKKTGTCRIIFAWTSWLLPDVIQAQEIER